MKTVDVIGIDEGQFFPDVKIRSPPIKFQIVAFSETMAKRGKIVIIAALDGTFQRKAFGDVIMLIPLAEKVKKLHAVCIECGIRASFTLRTVDSKETELIGGSEIYKPVCRGCYYRGTQDEEQEEQLLSLPQEGES